MSLPPVDPRLWLAWATFVGAAVTTAVVWFGVMEAVAIANSVGGDTLTEVVRRMHIPPVVWFLGGGLLAGLVVGFVAWWPLHLSKGL